MVLETKGKHRSYKTRDQRQRHTPLPPLHLYLHSRAGASSRWAEGWGYDVAEAVGQNVFCLIVDVFPAVCTGLNRSYHMCY